MIVAHVSDLHIKRRGQVLTHMPHVAGPLRRTLRAIESIDDDVTCIIATGDLTDCGSPEAYAKLREILAETQVPVYLLPGNHDRREALRRIFHDHAYLHESGQAILYTVESDLMRIVALDSSEPPMRGGYVDTFRLVWLDQTLSARPHTPTIVAMHHPPFRTGVGAFDSQEFTGRAALSDVIRKHRQIRRIICGHIHQMMCTPWSGTIAVSAPSTAPTLSMRSRGAPKWEPGGFLLHRYDWNADVTTQIVRTSADPEAVSA